MRDLVVSKKCDNKKGFTLIELTIVLIIMSFLFAVAGPRIAKSLSGLSLTTSTKKVAAALRYARSQAVNKSQVYSVIIDREHAQVVIRGMPKPVPQPPDEAAQEEFATEEEAAEDLKRVVNEVKLVPVAEGVSFQEISIGGQEFTGGNEELPQMIFFPDGTSQGGEIVLANNRERAFTVGVDFLTGVVTIAEKTT
jgi:general secretion pathway protein H